MQVDCAGVSLLMTGSPHTSMPYAMHHFKPWLPGQGFFYVQDERYVAGAGRARLQGCRRYEAKDGLGRAKQDARAESNAGATPVSLNGTSRSGRPPRRCSVLFQDTL